MTTTMDSWLVLVFLIFRCCARYPSSSELHFISYSLLCRYKKLLCMVDLTKDFFFSYSYHVMRTLQRNLCDTQSEHVLYETMFVWNEFLTRGIRNNLQNTLWTVALVYGFFKQVSGKNLVSNQLFDAGLWFCWLSDFWWWCFMMNRGGFFLSLFKWCLSCLFLNIGYCLFFCIFTFSVFHLSLSKTGDTLCNRAQL